MDKEPRKAGRTTISSRYIPGTVVDRTKMNGAAGESFLDKVFYITEGIMLTQVREITGIDGTTLQNWLKRGWVASPKGKYYTKEHLARILLIAMMRDTMQLARVSPTSTAVWEMQPMISFRKACCTIMYAVPWMYWPTGNPQV